MKKNSVKITVGWILIVIQCLAFIGKAMSGTPFPVGVPGFFNVLGFLIFGIIGAILLFIGYKNGK